MDAVKRVIAENIRLPITASDDDFIAAAKRKLSSINGVGKILSGGIYKKSVDARHKDSISFVCSVYADVELSDGVSCDTLASCGVRISSDGKIEIDSFGSEPMLKRPVIIGFGPAGMFSALFLARFGFKPLVLERGGSVDERVAAVELFNRNGILDENTNIQFGAGGAGTFSDGKLTTRIGDPYVRGVLEILASMGAPDTVLTKAKPHIGTDVLRQVVKNFHKEIERLGGTVKYGVRVSGVSDGCVMTDAGEIPCGVSVIAAGHSARDLYKSLYSSGFVMSAKPFSCGVRIEHRTESVDRAMYGDESLSEILGHAEYSLSYRKGERGVYSFCMCPGGTVVAASSEAGGIVTNGMSNSKRDGENSNAAIAVSVFPSDIGRDPMKAIAFQRSLETRAYSLGGSNYSAPCQSVGDFADGTVNRYKLEVSPSYRYGGVFMCDLNELFPKFISEMLKSGLSVFGKKISGFDGRGIPLTGPETRTSSPVRIERNERYLAHNFNTVYPCGEGAGYAGGIVSAAVDGIRVAKEIISRYDPERISEE